MEAKKAEPVEDSYAEVAPLVNVEDWKDCLRVEESPPATDVVSVPVLFGTFLSL